jgi:hypothetical protein
VTGDVNFGRNVTLRGTVIIVANEGQRIDIPDGCILENRLLSGNLNMIVRVLSRPFMFIFFIAELSNFTLVGSLTVSTPIRVVQSGVQGQAPNVNKQSSIFSPRFPLANRLKRLGLSFFFYGS